MKKKLVSSLKSRRKRGLSLIEISASLIIMAAVSVSMAVMFAQYTEQRKAKNAADKMTMVHEAANGYIKAHYSELMGQTAGNRKVVVQAGRSSINGAVPDGSLQRLGFLPSSYIDRNSYGQGHALIVRQATPASGGNPYLEAIVTTHGGQPIPNSQLGTVSGFVGVSGGYYGGYNIQAADQNMIVGTNGGWRSQLNDWNNAQVTITSGTVQSTLAFENGNLVTDYLYRNAVPGLPDLNTMNTAINMGGNNINRVGAIVSNTANRFKLDDSGLEVIDVWARNVTATGHTSLNTVSATNVSTGGLSVSGNASVGGNLSASSATIPTLNGPVDMTGKVKIAQIDLNGTIVRDSSQSNGFNAKNIQLRDLLPRTVAQYSYQVTEDPQNYPGGIAVYKPNCKRSGGKEKIMVYRQIESYTGDVSGDKAEMSNGVFAEDFDTNFWKVKWEGSPPQGNIRRSAIAQTFCSYEFADN